MMTILTDELHSQLIALAQDARQKAYAPYSNYKVGAALVTPSGRFFTGCNVENAAYPTRLCQRGSVSSPLSPWSPATAARPAAPAARCSPSSGWIPWC
jgi:hypothetical protein